jgi:membrane protease YdiL (CAAX protease family)
MAAQHWFFLGLLALGYGIALSVGSLDWPAMGAFALLGIAGACVMPQRRALLRAVGHGLFIVTGLALACHLLPGFNNARVIDGVRFSEDAAPFSMALNLDKPLLGFWVLLACPWLLPNVSWRRSLWVTALILPCIAAVCLSLAFFFDVIGWSPKWPPQGSLWLLNNLLLVSVTEELFFRAYLQGHLETTFKRLKFGAALSIGISAALFGLAHFSAGGEMVLLAAVAGVGYGIAWRTGGIGSSILCHFGLNLLHFTLFTYPLSAGQALTAINMPPPN